MAIAPSRKGTITVGNWMAKRISLCRAPWPGIPINGGATSPGDSPEDKREAAFRIWVASRCGRAGGGTAGCWWWRWKAWRVKNNKMPLLYHQMLQTWCCSPVDAPPSWCCRIVCYEQNFNLVCPDGDVKYIFKLVLSVKHSILFFLLVMSPGMGWLPQVVPNKVVPSPSLEIIRAGGKAEGQNRQQNRILRNYLIVRKS